MERTLIWGVPLSVAMPEPASRRRRGTGTGPEAPVKGPALRMRKLIPGGTEEGHPLTPEELRRARAPRDRFEVAFEPTPLGVPCWTVRGSSGQVYRVVVPGFPDRQGAQCTCRDFTTRGLGTCKHLEATLARAAASPPEALRASLPSTPPPVAWAELEAMQARALERAPGPGGPDGPRLLLALRRVGRRLAEA